MFVVIKNPGNLRLLATSSTDAVVSQLKTLGVKGVDRKKTPKSWIQRGLHKYVGVSGSEIVVHVS